MLSYENRVLGWHLGLGDLGGWPSFRCVDEGIELVPICHGYVHACVCDDCLEREDLALPEPIRQPWEIEAA